MRAHANLAIASLEPEEGIRAAGVRWRMEVAVQNFGPATARNVPVLLHRGRPGPAPRDDRRDPAGRAWPRSIST